MGKVTRCGGVAAWLCGAPGEGIGSCGGGIVAVGAEVGEVDGVRTRGLTGGMSRSSRSRSAARSAGCERWA